MPKRAETTWPAGRDQLAGQSTPIPLAAQLASRGQELSYGQQRPAVPACQNRAWFHDQAQALRGAGSVSGQPARGRPANPAVPCARSALTAPQAAQRGAAKPSPRATGPSPGPPGSDSLQVKALAMVKAAAQRGSSDELSSEKSPRIWSDAGWLRGQTTRRRIHRRSDGGPERRSRCPDGGPEHRYECYTETPPYVSRPNYEPISAQRAEPFAEPFRGP
jgi:hypothetical protein